MFATVLANCEEKEEPLAHHGHQLRLPLCAALSAPFVPCPSASMLLLCCCSLDLEQFPPCEALPWEMMASDSSPEQHCVSAAKLIVQTKKTCSFGRWLYIFLVLMGLLRRTGLRSRAPLLLRWMLMYKDHCCKIHIFTAIYADIRCIGTAAVLFR